VFDYNSIEKESLSCNLCGQDDFSVIAVRSKNDLPVRTVMCKNCSLIYINPRMTSEDYDKYYKYHYRQDRNSIKSSTYDTDLERNFSFALKFGHAMAETMGQFFTKGLTIDIGSSTGGVLHGLKEKLPDLDVLGVEPSIDESNFAQSKGVKTNNAIFEEWKNSEDIKEASNIICVQSLNHLLDPKGFIDWSYDNLKNEGHLFLAVKNFRHQVRRAGKISSGVQIDHPYMFTPESLRCMVESCGFEVRYIDVDEGKSLIELSKIKKRGFSVHHIRLVAVKKRREGESGLKCSGLYRKERSNFYPITVKLYYLLKYSKKLEILRKILHIK